MEMNECIAEFNTRQGIRPMYWLCSLLHDRWFIGFLWKIVTSTCMFMIEILDAKSNGKINRCTVEYYVRYWIFVNVDILSCICSSFAWQIHHIDRFVGFCKKHAGILSHTSMFCSTLYWICNILTFIAVC